MNDWQKFLKDNKGKYNGKRWFQKAKKDCEIARKRSLGIDPASGKHRPEEEEAAIRLEQITGRLRRDPSGEGDWIDKNSRVYDAVGPVPIGRFKLPAFIRQIDKHLLKQGVDIIVLDLTGLSRVERDGVLDHIGHLSATDQGRILIQP